MDKNFLIDWCKKHCKSREEIVKEKSIAEEEAIYKLDNIILTSEPIIFDRIDFSSDLAFSTALFISSERYKDSEDVKVIYSKPIDKETGNVSYQFSIVKV